MARENLRNNGVDARTHGRRANCDPPWACCEMEGDFVSMQYFLADPAAYEQARNALNAAWGIPKPGTDTSLPVASELIQTGGRVVVMVDDWMVDLAPATDIVAAALASGDLKEITESQVQALLPQA